MSTIQLIGLSGLALGVVNLAVLGLEYSRKNTFDLGQLPLTRAVTWLTRLFIGVLFIYSGFVKANDYIGFSYKLTEYFEVFSEDFSWFEGFFKFWIPYAEPLAWFISVFEIALAFAIILGWQMNLTAWLTLLMMVFFTILTGYSHFTGAVTDCGCFGDALKIEPWESFSKDLILLVMIAPLFILRKTIKAFPSGAVATAITALSFVIAGAYSYYCYENLPRVDYRPYKVGKDLNICTTQPGPDGLIKCKDWDEIYRLGEDYSVLEGDVMMMVMYDMEKIDEEALKSTGPFARDMKSVPGLRVIGATSTGKSVVEGYVKKYVLEYDFSFRDLTMLKTIIRSNPGYVLMRNGVILAKWHHNNQPDAAEVKALLK
ncbi:MAG: DoxX family protein [Bacteroidota bacterium]